jgi:sulfate transport system permease protein
VVGRGGASRPGQRLTEQIVLNLVKIPRRLKRHSVLPGFGLSLGYAMIYLTLIVLLPLSATVWKTAQLTFGEFWATITDPRVVASYKLTFLASLLAASINAAFGLLVAWVLVRYRFPGRRFLDAIVDLPFALPTAVAGIALTTLYAKNGWIGQYLDEFGIKVAYTPLGIIVALTFIGLPFVVRTVQPILEDLSSEVEEAAASLGATPFQTFRRVILPELWPAVLTGFTLAFARALGEYGSVVFISGNMPMKTEITPLLIITKLEQYQYSQATAIAVVMLGASFTLLLAINALQRWTASRSGVVL